MAEVVLSRRWLLFVCLFATSLFGGDPPPCPRLVLEAYPHSEIVGREFRPRAISLKGTGFRGTEHENAVYLQYVASLDYSPRHPSKRQVRAAIQTIAAETDREAALSFTTGFTQKAAERTRAKIDLRTGDFLLVDHTGQVSGFTRLPLGRRALGETKDLAEFASVLSSYTFVGNHSYSRLAAGEDLGVAFFSPHNRNTHFNKHVLGCPSGLSLRQWLSRYQHDFLARKTSFPQLQEQFARSLLSGRLRRQKVEESYRQFVKQYEERAERFLRSTSATALSSTAIHHFAGARVLTSIKFDVQTLELAIVNRQDQVIVTYYRVTELFPSNDHLRYRLHAEPVESALEYFLVLALSEHDRP